MPNRVIREGFIDSERVDSLSPSAECLYHRLLLVCDDAGRFDGRINVIAARCWPNRPNIRVQDVAKWLTEVTNSGLAVSYESGGKSVLQIMNWACVGKAKFSKYPDQGGGFAITFVQKETRDGVKLFVTSSTDGIPTPSRPHTDGVRPHAALTYGDGDEDEDGVVNEDVSKSLPPVSPTPETRSTPPPRSPRSGRQGQGRGIDADQVKDPRKLLNWLHDKQHLHGFNAEDSLIRKRALACRERALMENSRSPGGVFHKLFWTDGIDNGSWGSITDAQMDKAEAILRSLDKPPEKPRPAVVQDRPPPEPTKAGDLMGEFRQRLAKQSAEKGKVS